MFWLHTAEVTDDFMNFTLLMILCILFADELESRLFLKLIRRKLKVVRIKVAHDVEITS